MNSNVIPASALVPSFNLPAEQAFTSSPKADLLGQERSLDAFRLLTVTDNQHMFLADYFGCNRKRIIDALVKEQGQFPPLSLVLDDKVTAWVEHDEHSDNRLATKTHEYQYLSGSIRKVDLVGRYHSESQTYEAGLLASCHYLFICADSLWKRENLWDLLLEILDKQTYQVHSQLP
ncbi:ATP-dependent protease, partial [Shewanella sp. 0m-11]